MMAKAFSKKCDLSRQKTLFEVCVHVILFPFHSHSQSICNSVHLQPNSTHTHTQSQKFSFLQFQGKVDLKSPQHIFYILEDYGENPHDTPPEPLRVFFGRLIAHGQRHLIQEYSIKTRHFIGNTSMDAQLSFIMANQAKVCGSVHVCDVCIHEHGVCACMNAWANCSKCVACYRWRQGALYMTPLPAQVRHITVMLIVQWISYSYFGRTQVVCWLPVLILVAMFWDRTLIWS